MSVQVYSVPDQTEGRRKTFLEWGDGNVNHYKSVYHPIPTRGNREQPSNLQNKSVSCPFNWVSRYILFLPKLKGRGRPFLKGARKGTALWDYPQENICDKTLKSLFCVKFEIILPLLYFLLDPLTNKHYRTWSSMINLWIYSSTCQK